MEVVLKDAYSLGSAYSPSIVTSDARLYVEKVQMNELCLTSLEMRARANKPAGNYPYY